MLTHKSAEDIDKMSDQDFDQYSQDAAREGVEPTPVAPAPKDPAAPADKPEDKPADGGDKPADKDPAAPADKPEDKPADGGDKDDDEDGADDGQNKNKRVPFIPYKKHTKLVERAVEKATAELREEYEQKLKGINAAAPAAPAGTAPSADRKQLIQDFAKEYALDEAFVEKLLALVPTSESKLPNDIAEKLAKWEAANEAQNQIDQFEEEYSAEESAKDIFSQINPSATPAQYKEAKKILRDFAFSSRYLKYPLADIISLNRQKFEDVLVKGKVTAESSHPAQRNATVDYDNVSTDDISNMSDKEFDEYSSEMGKRNGSGLRIYDKNGREVKD